MSGININCTSDDSSFLCLFENSFTDFFQLFVSLTLEINKLNVYCFTIGLFHLTDNRVQWISEWLLKGTINYGYITFSFSDLVKRS